MKGQFSESAITDLIAHVTPWLAPLPNAYLVYRTSIDALGWPWLVALAAGIVIEALGLSAVHTALEFRSHNRGLKKDDKRTSPYGLATFLVIVYLLSVTALTVILDTMPELARYAPLIFPIISLCGVTIIGIRTDHRRLVADMTLSLAPPYNKKRHRLERSRLLAELEGIATPVTPAARVDVVEMTPVALIPAVVPPTVADFRAWAAGINGDDADVTLKDAMAAMAERGLDADNKNQRDKVGRWFRGWNNHNGSGAVEILEGVTE